MRLLFAITVLCFCAVLWVALALARRIRLGLVLSAKQKPARKPANREFFETGEFRTPRPLHLDQEIFQQKPRRALSEIHLAFEHGAPSLHPVTNQLIDSFERPKNSAPVPIRPAAATYATLFGQNVSIAQIETNHGTGNDFRNAGLIDSRRSLPVPQKLGASASPAPPFSRIDFMNRRIPPKSVRASGLRRRVDLSHFNKDMGDLIDPYTTPSRGSGTLGLAAVDNRFRLER